MKKISFNERYGLQQVVIKGTKPTTRRAEKSLFLLDELSEWHISDYTQKEGFRISFTREDGIRGEYYIKPRYAIGEVVAVAQRYKDCWDYYQQLWEAKNDPSDWHTPDAILGDQVNETPGWKNKMFVRSDLMPHRIRITDIKAERLQDISDEDCQKEGVVATHGGYGVEVELNYQVFASTPREAFAALINRVCGRGTWERNLWVFVYEFELIK